jgi:hypothetical protein
MNTYELEFEETVSVKHTLVVKTEMSLEELEDEIGSIRFRDECIGDVSCILSDKLGLEIEEIIEGDPETTDMDCVDIG